MSLLSLEKATYVERGAGIREVDLEVERGDCLVAFGRSGSGKRTLMRVAAGVSAPQSGSARIDRPEKGLPVGWVPNEGGLLNNLSLLQNAALPIVYHGLASFEDAFGRARDLFDMLGAAAVSARRPAQVGAGSRRLAVLARAMLAAPSLYVLDEPLDDVDVATARTVQRVLARLKKDPGATALVSTGTLRPYLDWGTRFLYVREGRLTVFASKAEVLASKDPEIRMFLED